MLISNDRVQENRLTLCVRVQNHYALKTKYVNFEKSESRAYVSLKGNPVRDYQKLSSLQESSSHIFTNLQLTNEP
ncbi:hypothetical protein RchiOBHm_Chr2g0157871 [Rosa chinensis]|uniref:Uncharacterized protein n=1 Tax=Rosa chinensis TaxID=74649 RepID=A0A2P6S1U8_ROSCH|nr:hypothetical protein RchiOBHm_Chr2g0157871 [Rosa chinensis]